MRRRILATAAVLLVVGTAGCSGLFPVGEPSGSSREPYDVPTSEVEETVTESGADRDRVSVDTLALSHASALEGKSFSVEYEEEVSAANGTVLRKDHVLGQVAANRTRFVLSKGRWRLGNTWTYDRFWSEGSGASVLHAIERADATEYVAYSDPNAPALRVKDVVPGGARFPTRIFRILSTVGDANVTATNGAGSLGYFVRVTEFTDEWLLHGGRRGTVSDPSLQLLVSQSGVIESLYLTYNVSVGNRTLRYEEAYRFRSVGTTEVTAPGWRNVSMASVEQVRLNRSPDSVGLPLVSGGGTSFGDDNESDNGTNPYPPRSFGGSAGTDVHRPPSPVESPSAERGPRERPARTRK